MNGVGGATESAGGWRILSVVSVEPDKVDSRFSGRKRRRRRESDVAIGSLEMWWVENCAEGHRWEKKGRERPGSRVLNV